MTTLKQLRETSTTKGGFSGNNSQAAYEMDWIKTKIESLKPLLAKKPNVARQIKDLERQHTERQLSIAFTKKRPND